MNCDSAKRGEGEARHGDSNKDFQQADVYHKMIVEIEDKVAVEKEREAEYKGSKPENATPTFTTKDGEQNLSSPTRQQGIKTAPTFATMAFSRP